MSLFESRVTPITPDYESCAECRAKLLIYPNKIHPDQVSALLGIEATTKLVSGTTVTNSRGRKREVKISCWFLSSEGKVKSRDLRDHLNWLLEKLKYSSLGLRRLQNMEGVKMTVSCVWWSKSGFQGPVLWPEQMKALANLNLGCAFDIYFDHQESE